MFPKYRGKQVLMRDENGLEKCVACGLCAVACPADAIYLEAAENDGTVQAGPRYATIYQIHKTRCIFCGYCEEACPVSAIFMGKDYELAVYSNKDFIWDKEDLLVPAPTPASLTAAGLPRRPDGVPRRVTAFLDALDARVLVCDGAMGTMLYAKRHLPQPLLRRAEPHAARSGRRGPPGLRARRRRRHRDQHVRRQPLQAGATSAWPTRCARSTSQGARIARHAARDARLGRRLDRPARRAHRAVGQDRRRRGARTRFASRPRRSPRAASICSCSRRSATSNEIGAAIRARARRLATADRRADDDRGRRQQPRRHAAGDVRAASWSARGADVIGVNCSVGPAAMLETIERMARASPTRGCRRSRTPAGRATSKAATSICARPNTWRRYARRFIAAGVRLVGGCCGTTPEHIRQIARGRRTAPVAGGAPARRRRHVRPRSPPPRRPPVPRGREVAAGQRAVARPVRASAVELAPPRGHADAGLVERGARSCASAASTRCSSPTARAAGARMSALAAALLLEQQAGVETVLQYRCRDRNCSACSPSCSARTRSGCATSCSSPASRRGRPTTRRDLRRSTSDSIGADQRGGAAQSRPGHRRPADRRADRVPHRRRASTPRRSTSTGGAALPLQGRGGRRVRDDRAGLRRRRRGPFPDPRARRRSAARRHDP